MESGFWWNNWNEWRLIMPFNIQGFADPNYQVKSVAGNAPELPSGMSKLNEIIDYQNKNLALQKQQALQQPQIEQGIAQSETAKTQSEEAKFGLQKSYQTYAQGLVNGLINDPDVINGNKDGILKKLTAIEDFTSAVGMPKHPSGAIEQARKLAQEDPSAVHNYFASRIVGQMSPSGQASLNQLTTAGGQPAVYNSAQGTLSPVGFTGQQAPNQNAPAQNGAQGQGGITSSQMEMPQLQYPPRVAGQPYAPGPTETQDREVGNQYKNSLISSQTNLSTMRRNVDEVIKEAANLEKSQWFTSGKPGDIQRGLETFFGTEAGIKYKQLSKDLANAQITAIKASGGNLETDAGKKLISAANGDETFPPKVLIGIARRTQADMTNLDMQATAAQKFATKYGDQNMNSFKQMWSKNADSKVFELKNIYDDPNLSTKEKDEARTRLLGNDPKVLKDFQKKWNNIDKLEKYGSL